MGIWWLSMALGFSAAGGSLPVQPLEPAQAFGQGALVRRDGEGRYWLTTGIEGLPGFAGWRIEERAPCVAIASASVEEAARAPVILGKDFALPGICAQQFEGSCASRDGRVRVTTSFKGKRRTKRTRAGFYGGEGWQDDTFYTGERTLVIEDAASGKRALFVERLRDVNGYSKGAETLSYLPEMKAVLVLGMLEDRNPSRSYCIRLP